VVSTAYQTVPANSDVLLSSFSASALSAIAPATIIRTRGILSVKSDQSAASEVQFGGFGIALVNEAARAAGVASLPSASSMIDDRFFVLQPFLQQFLLLDASGFDARNDTSYIIDSKAMRKITNDDGLVFVAGNNHATHGLQVSFMIRHLVKSG